MQNINNTNYITPSDFPVNLVSRIEVQLYPFIYTAPMATIFDENDIDKFIKHNICVTVPRNVPIELRMELAQQYGFDVCIALSLSELENILSKTSFIDNLPRSKYLLDMANGHLQYPLQCLEDLAVEAPHVKVYGGNIANAGILPYYVSAGICGVRIGIGSGSACATTDYTGVGANLNELLIKCSEYPIEEKIADGGLKTYADINRALYFGATHVMLGSMFARCADIATKYVKNNVRTYYGMSTPEMQKLIGSNIRPSEGYERTVECDTTLDELVENIYHYLRSAVSYVSDNLYDFKFNW